MEELSVLETELKLNHVIHNVVLPIVSLTHGLNGQLVEVVLLETDQELQQSPPKQLVLEKHVSMSSTLDLFQTSPVPVPDVFGPKNAHLVLQEIAVEEMILLVKNVIVLMMVLEDTL